MGSGNLVVSPSVLVVLWLADVPAGTAEKWQPSDSPGVVTPCKIWTSGEGSKECHRALRERAERHSSAQRNARG